MQRHLEGHETDWSDFKILITYIGVHSVKETNTTFNDNNSKLHLVESEKRLMETQIQAQKNIITSLEIEVAVLKKADARQAQQLNSG